MNDILSLIKKRYSVRNYMAKPVPRAKLMKVLEAGRFAPSAANYQPWHYIVVQDKEMIIKIGKAFPRVWFVEAPVIIIVCGDHKKSWKREDGKDHTYIDVAITVDHMTLAAAEEGLGTCWVCNFNPKMISELFTLPEHIEPVVMLPLGFPDTPTDKYSRHESRLKLEEIVHWEKF